MATDSFPVDGVDGFTISDYSAFWDSRDGGAECYSANDLQLSLSDAGSTVTINTGSVEINGYRLIISGDSLPCPTPTSGTVTYYVVAYYDPLLNIAGAGDAAPVGGACRWGIYSTSDVTSAMAGKLFVLLWSITRTAGQPLSSAATKSYLRFIGGPTVEWPASVPDAPPVGNKSMPRGTIRVAPDARKIMLRTPVNGTVAWWDVLNDGPFAFPAPSSLVANSGIPQYRIVAGTMIKCSGTLKRSSGSLSQGSNDVTLGTFPVGRRPSQTERYLCKIGSGKGYIEVRVDAASGVVTMTGETGVDWIDISPIFFSIA